MLAERGAVIVDADQIARDLQAPGSPMLAAMADRFGSHILQGDGSLDRAAVASLVFGDGDEQRTALHALNAITHPAIRAEIQAQIDVHRGCDHIVVLDFPLLGENPRDDLAATVVVDIAPELAIERLVRFRNMSKIDARNRIASQISREQRLAAATHVIDNNADRVHLAAEVDAVWCALTSGLGDPAR